MLCRVYMIVLWKPRTWDSSQKQELSPSHNCKLPPMNFMYCHHMEISKGNNLVTLYLHYNGLWLVFNFIYTNLNQRQPRLMKLCLLYKAIEATLKLSSRMKSQEAIKENQVIYSSFINFLFFIIFKFTEYSLYNFRYASYYTVNCAFYQTTILDSLYCKTIQYSLVSSSFCGPFLCDFSYGCMCDYRDFETVLYFDCFCEI